MDRGKDVITLEKQHRLMFEKERDFFWFVTIRENERYFLKKYFGHRNPSDVKVLDAGCGAGFLVKELQEMGYRAQGFDYSEAAVGFCTERGLKRNVDVFQKDIFNLDFADNSFDCIFFNDVLCLYEIPDGEEMFKGLTRILKPGGMIIGQTSAFQFLYSQNDIVAGTAHRYTGPEVRAIFDKSGLIPVKVSYRNFIIFVPFALLRVLSRTADIKREEAKSDLREMSGLLNIVLKFVFRIDNFFMRYLNYPFGGTIFWAGRKKER